MTFLSRVASLAGLDLKAVGPRNLRLASQAAMRRLNLGEEGYLARLASAPDERALLSGEAVVQETWLFRDPDSFTALGRFASALPRPFRVLCVPCSTGEEPASAAVALVRAGLSPDDFHIDAADANPSALAKARTGRFDLASLRGGCLPEPHLMPDGENLVLDPALRERIRFFQADALDTRFLAQEPPFQAVLCRHLLIYLAAEARKRLAATVARLLAPEGRLFTTPAEAAPFAGLGLIPFGYGPPRMDVAQAEPCPRPSPSRPPLTRRELGQPPAAPSQPTARAENPGELARRAAALADAGQLEEALCLLRTALDAGPPSARLFHLKGAALLALGRLDEAERALRRAIYLEPGHVEALSHLEHLARAKGQAHEAALLAVRARKAGEAAG